MLSPDIGVLGQHDAVRKARVSASGPPQPRRRADWLRAAAIAARRPAMVAVALPRRARSESCCAPENEFLLEQFAGALEIRLRIAQLGQALFQVRLCHPDLRVRLFERGAHVPAFQASDRFVLPDAAALEHAEPLEPALAFRGQRGLALRDDINPWR